MPLTRRDFLSRALLGSTAAIAPGWLAAGCASKPVYPRHGGVEELLADGARVMWVAAHPDDEALVGSILARASRIYHSQLYFLILTHGDGGECCRPEGCEPDMVTVRGAEMKRVAELYRAELQHEYFYNAPLPVESFPPRHEIAKLWKAKKDPAMVVADAVRRFKPDVIFTFDPFHGFTGHPEHQLTSRFTTAGVRLAADSKSEVNGYSPHRVEHVYFGLNRYGPMVFLGKADPGPVTETWNARQLCGNGWECREVMAHFSRAHRSQDRDMGTVRNLVWLFDYVYLRKTNPYTEILDPYEESFVKM